MEAKIVRALIDVIESFIDCDGSDLDRRLTIIDALNALKIAKEKLADYEIPERVGARLYREGKGVSHFWGEAPDTSVETLSRMAYGYQQEMQKDKDNGSV